MVLHSLLQIHPDAVYLKEEFGEATEFPLANGKFDLLRFADGQSFEVIEASSSTATPIPQNLQISASTPQHTPIVQSTSKSRLRRQALVVIKVNIYTVSF